MNFIDMPTKWYYQKYNPFSWQVKVTYPNQESAAGVHLVRTTKTLDEHGNNLMSQSFIKQAADQTTAVTDINGIAMFVINVASQARKLTINVCFLNFNT